MKINIAVMAGGQSRRFNGDKTLELFDGKPLISHSIDRLSGLADNIIIVAKDCSKYSFLDVPCIVDAYGVQCPMVGILTALKHFQTPVFVVAADVPFPEPEHVRRLYSTLNDFHAVIPDIDGVQHPLYSCYNISIINALEAAVEAGEYGLMKTVKNLNINYINELALFSSASEKKSFININTREEYTIAKKYTGETDG